ncbi:MAG TPA: hypothetical protein VFA60_02800 [Terriglobales bacterium]|nr:hypothetical protein [Terriglobales bacterium]
MRRILSGLVVLFTISAAAGPAALAQDGMQEVLKRLDALEKKVRDLEQQNQSLTRELSAARASANLAARMPPGAIATHINEFRGQRDSVSIESIFDAPHEFCAGTPFNDDCTVVEVQFTGDCAGEQFLQVGATAGAA